MGAPYPPATVRIVSAGWHYLEDVYGEPTEEREFRFVCALEGPAPAWPLEAVFDARAELTPLGAARATGPASPLGNSGRDPS